MNITEEYKKSLKMIEVEEVLDLILYRPLALVFVRGVHKTPITPNGVTFLSLIGGLLSAYCFAQGTASGLMWGGIWYAIANVLDCSDGQLARLQGSGTPLGRLVDGVIDWIISVAIFVGLGIGLQSSTGDPGVWWLVSIGGATSAVHAFFFDLYQQQFISTVRGQENFVDRELAKIKSEFAKLDVISHNLLRKTFLSIYIKYLEGQRGSRSPEVKGQHYPPDLYRSTNKNVMRFWTLLGPTTNRSLLVVGGVLNNLGIFLWPVVTVGNALLMIALVWQRRVLRQLDKTLKQQTLTDRSTASVTA